MRRRLYWKKQARSKFFQQDQSGVYFLIKNGNIVYIGQTQYLSIRLMGHDKKDYDKFRLINCKEEKRLEYERRLIRYFEPILNRKQGRKISPDGKSVHVGFYLRADRIEELGGMAAVRKIAKSYVEQTYRSQAII